MIKEMELSKVGKTTTKIADLQLWLMAIPGALVLIIFFYMPLFGTISAFQDFDIVKGYFGSEFSGLENFRVLFANDDIWIAVRNTLGLSLLKLAIVFPIPIIFAILLNEINHAALKRIIQTVSYVPHFVSWIIVIGIWGSILAVEGGIVNQVIESLGGEPINFMTSRKHIWPIVLLMDAWKETGWSAIIYIAAMSSINPMLYEAAQIDGAGRFKQILHITLPGIRSTIVVLLILAIPNLMNGNLDQMYAIGNVANRGVTEIVDTYVLRTGIGNGQYGLASAAGLAKSLISVILLLITNKVAKLLGEPGIL